MRVPRPSARPDPFDVIIDLCILIILVLVALGCAKLVIGCAPLAIDEGPWW